MGMCPLVERHRSPPRTPYFLTGRESGEYVAHFTFLLALLLLLVLPVVQTHGEWRAMDLQEKQEVRRASFIIYYDVIRHYS